MEQNKYTQKKSSTSSKISKRRSKSDIDGRTFSCEHCQKSYLSYPALYTHKKIKHETNNGKGRSRGRPKKEQNENIMEKNRYNPINITFFAKEGRTGKTSPNEINKCIENAYIDLLDEEIMKKYDSLEDNPFLDKFVNDNHDIYRNIINMHEIADTVFINYLTKMSAFCNSEYYQKLIRFVLLFREYINNINFNKKVKDSKDYTQINDAEKIPIFSNGFLNDFLYPNDEEISLGFEKDESIDLIQNICYWMYDNNFTSFLMNLKQ